MYNNGRSSCNALDNSLGNSWPDCGTTLYAVSDLQRVLKKVTLLCIAIMAGFFTFGQSIPAVAG